MIIRSFSGLSSTEKNKLHEYICRIGFHDFTGLSSMEKYFSSIMFNRGENSFSLWEGNDVKGTMAIITKDVPEKGEVFITGLWLGEEEKWAFAPLVARAMEYSLRVKPRGIKLGVKPSMRYIVPLVIEHGFTEVYQAMVLKHEGDEQLPGLVNGVTFESLAELNMPLYIDISNRAFINSPNGGTTDKEEIKEIMERSKDNPHFAGICFFRGIPSGVYELSLEDGTGWINAIAVDPCLQGKKIGRALLRKSIESLWESGAREIKLLVISSNDRALEMYQKYGFKEEKVTSLWFEKVPQDALPPARG